MIYSEGEIKMKKKRKLVNIAILRCNEDNDSFTFKCYRDM